MLSHMVHGSTVILEGAIAFKQWQQGMHAQTACLPDVPANESNASANLTRETQTLYSPVIHGNHSITLRIATWSHHDTSHDI